MMLLLNTVAECQLLLRPNYNNFPLFCPIVSRIDCVNCIDEQPVTNRWTMPLHKIGDKKYYIGTFFKACILFSKVRVLKQCHRRDLKRFYSEAKSLSSLHCSHCLQNDKLCSSGCTCDFDFLKYTPVG